MYMYNVSYHIIAQRYMYVLEDNTSLVLLGAGLALYLYLRLIIGLFRDVHVRGREDNEHPEEVIKLQFTLYIQFGRVAFWELI